LSGRVRISSQGTAKFVECLRPIPDIALMSHVKLEGATSRLPAISRGVFDAMIVQWWGRSLETSVIKL
jgi:hypothetical protein